MKQMLNVLLGMLYALSFISCIMFKNAFVYIVFFTFILFTLVIVKNKNNECSNVINLVSISWLLLCNIIALSFKFINNVNVFDVFNTNYIFFLIYGGLIILSLTIQLYLNRQYKLKNQ